MPSGTPPNSPFVSFVVPTIWRPTLGRTIDSLVAQTDPDWEAVVAADPDYSPTVGWMPGDDRVTVIDASEGGSPGAVRNAAFPYLEGEWVGFVDDDDTLTPDYVAALRDETAELVLFRRRQCGSNIEDCAELGPGAVGIHFAVRASKLAGHLFATSGDEDWGLFKALMDGCNFHLSNRVAYLVWAGKERRI